MALAETIVAIFLFLCGTGFLYLSKKRETALGYPIVSAAIFVGNTLYSATIPFATNSSGEVIGTSANIALISINFIFFAIAVFVSISKIKDFIS